VKLNPKIPTQTTTEESPPGYSEAGEFRVRRFCWRARREGAGLVRYFKPSCFIHIAKAFRDDLRRALIEIPDKSISDFMTPNPVTVTPNALLTPAEEIKREGKMDCCRRRGSKRCGVRCRGDL